MGDVHPYGNPHYLLDPVNGLRVAALLRDRFAARRPERGEALAERYRALARELAARLAGPELAGTHDPETVVRAVEDGTLATLAARTHPGGWLGELRRTAGSEAVEDHKLWEYLARRFDIALVATLEPKPGIAPTTSHLEEVVKRIQERRVRLILTSPYFDPRHARWVAERTGARVVPLSHQTGARDGTGDYLANVEYNVRALREALGSHGG
jgi:ABC-type Zn uptake system ZnuABC Zn-binding protein ZnuA